MINEPIFSFLIIMLMLQAKHFMMDFPPKPYYKMMSEAVPFSGWIHPLAFHGTAHGIGTFITFALSAWYIGLPALLLPLILGIIDAIVHICIDFTVLSYTHEQKDMTLCDDKFMHVFGFDQMLHVSGYIILTYVFLKVI